MTPTLDEIFERLTDFELADGIAYAAEIRYGYDRLMSWPDDIPLPQRVVHFIWSNTGFAACEGYVEFMMLACHHSALAFSFREVGLDDLADVVDRMLAPVPAAGVLGNGEALEKHFGGWDPFSAWVNQFEGTLFGASDRIHHAVALYCRSNKRFYEELLPELRTSSAYRDEFEQERS
jgi:hypothetical protein